MNTVWTRDGSRITYDRMDSAGNSICSLPIDGSKPTERLIEHLGCPHPGSWSPDGRVLAFVEHKPADLEQNLDILLYQPDREPRISAFLNGRHNESYPDFSPDGRWLAYASDESGRYEVYVRRYPERDEWHQISSEGGIQPVWAPSGSQIYYRSGNRFWAVDVKTRARLEASKPRVLFEREGYPVGDPIRNYDLSADGRKFLINKIENDYEYPVTEMIFVQNWFEELKRLVPTGR